MGFPICDSCASSGTLCPKCEDKVRSEKVSELDVLVSGILARGVATGYERILDLGNKLLIYAADSDVPKIIGPKGKTASELSKKLGRRVVVLSDSWDAERKVRSVVMPVKLAATNKVYKKGGGEVLKLIFDKPLDEATVLVVKEIMGEVEIGYQTDTLNFVKPGFVKR